MGKSWKESTSRAINIITECKGCILQLDTIISLSALSLHALWGLGWNPRALCSVERARNTVQHLRLTEDWTEGRKRRAGGQIEEGKKTVLGNPFVLKNFPPLLWGHHDLLVLHAAALSPSLAQDSVHRLPLASLYSYFLGDRIQFHTFQYNPWTDSSLVDIPGLHLSSKVQPHGSSYLLNSFPWRSNTRQRHRVENWSDSPALSQAGLSSHSPDHPVGKPCSFNFRLCPEADSSAAPCSLPVQLPSGQQPDSLSQAYIE